MKFEISASFNGFTMDETVKDEEPTAEEPEPQFSINDLDIKVSFQMHKHGRTLNLLRFISNP